MKGLILLVNGFEESEAIITIDLLRRANIEIDLVSLTNSLTVTSSGNITVSCDKLYSITKLEEYNFLVIPGGKAVFNYHLDSIVTKEIVDYFMSKNLVVAAICAAPMILGKYGYLKDKHFTCFPNCEEDHFGGIYEPEYGAVQDGNIITGKACGTTFDFAQTIIEAVLNTETADDVINKVYY